MLAVLEPGGEAFRGREPRQPLQTAKAEEDWRMTTGSGGAGVTVASTTAALVERWAWE